MRSKIIFSVLVACMLITAGCGNKAATDTVTDTVRDETVVTPQNDADDPGKDKATENNTSSDETPLNGTDNASTATDDPEALDKLPPYEYPGPELFYYVVYQYLVDELSAHYEAADVSIPIVEELYLDEDDKSDIKMYGEYWLLNYELDGDTLNCVSGGSYPGCLHIECDSEGNCRVTSFDIVADGSDYTPSAKKIFGDHYDDFVKLNSDQEKREEIRAQIIANYVAANNLNITCYKDYGWDPVTLPEENIDNFYSKLN